MMQDMYGLLKPEDEIEPISKDSKNMVRQSSSSSVNTQFIDDQIKKYENSQEMQQWKGALEKTFNRRFPGIIHKSSKDDGNNSSMRAYDVFKPRHGQISMRRDGDPN